MANQRYGIGQQGRTTEPRTFRLRERGRGAGGPRFQRFPGGRFRGSGTESRLPGASSKNRVSFKAPRPHGGLILRGGGPQAVTGSSRKIRTGPGRPGGGLPGGWGRPESAVLQVRFEKRPVDRAG